MNKNKKYAVTCLNATNVSYKTLVQNNSKIEIHFKYNLVEIAGCVICLPKSLKKTNKYKDTYSNDCWISLKCISIYEKSTFTLL